MKKRQFFVGAVMMLASISGVAQSSNNVDEVVKIDRHAAQEYRQGEMIVKFKPTSEVRVRSLNRSVSSGVSAVDKVFGELGITTGEQLMPLIGAKVTPRARALRSVSGKTIEDSDMSLLYRLTFDAQTLDVHQAVEKVAALDEVEFAEPNYVVYALSSSEASETYDTAEEAAAYMAEPLYSQQWGPAAIHLPELWAQPKITTKRPVIAILDTGVDITHPDLADNIWTNEAEADGAEGEDDDANGFKDDLHGWDFVNQTARIGDWNGHGTHCAGIAAAVGDNKIGITGANPDALIMPVTVMQSDGTGDVATIIKGIDYAAANGADVISMSIGGYGYSLAEEQALAKAYNTAVLVAAAGNDCAPINYIICPRCMRFGAPLFPAAFTFVLGVEASVKDGSLASFSNFDDDGPVFSQFSEEQLYNYELRAPGVNIMSTYPNGRYKSLNGTSMACPLVAGALSRYIQCKDFNNKEMLFGDLIHTSNGNMDIFDAYSIKDEDRKPTIWLVNYELKDTIDGDNDGRVDAGETISLYPTFRNDWGQAENITFSLEIGENEDPTIVEILDSKVTFGKPLSGYGKAKSSNPLRFKVREDCVDGRHIRLVFTAKCEGMNGEIRQELIMSVENGVEIGGIISDNTTLYSNVYYIVTSTILIPKDVTLMIMPGTVLRFKDGVGIKSEGSLVAQGTPDSMVVFQSAHLDGTANVNFDIDTGIISYVEFNNLILADFKMRKCKVRNIIMESCSGCYFYGYPTDENEKSHNVIKNSGLSNHADNIKETYTNIVNNKTLYTYLQMSNNVKNCNIFSNSFTNKNNNVYFSVTYPSSDITTFRPSEPSYLGSAKEEILRNYIIDYNNPIYSFGYGQLDINYVAKEPIRETHGIVWKVVVNGYDAQDEFEQLPPLGIGRHKFEVYFNRPMDTNFTPFIAMGVRPPYTQNEIAEEGSWNYERTVYTAYLTITGKTHTDGLNRIYVSDAVESVEDYFIRKEAQELLPKIEPLLNEIVNVPVNVALQASNSSKDGYLTALNKTSSSCSLLCDGKNTQSSKVNFYKDEYLQIDLGVDKNIRYFRFNYRYFSVYPPEKIIVQGSNDGIKFENVDSFSYLDKINPLSNVQDGSWLSLLIDALIPYRYYRFYFETDNSSGYCSIHEFGIEVLEHMVKDDYLNLLSDEYAFNVLKNNIIAEYDLCRIETRDNNLLQTTLDRMYTDYNKLASVLGFQTIYHNSVDVPSAPNWVIPVENMRFNVEVAAAGSMATGLMAEAGLGKVTLTWETDEEDFEDLLGYNMYRFTMDDNGVSSDSIIVNPTIIDSEETSFVDYDVVPGTTYYYVIKQLTTSLTSHALSNAVAATPLTASKGDANGSMNVDIADVVTEVAYITYQDPQPFIFEAADVNEDAKVNVLDVVGTIGIITNPAGVSVSGIDNNPVRYYVSDGILYVETAQALGGVQVRLDVAKGTEITALDGLAGMEQTGTWMSDSEYLFLAYSMSGRCIPAGTHALLQIGNEAIVTEMVLSDTKGKNITAVNADATGIGKVEAVQLQMPSPNPFTTVLHVPYTVGKSGSHEVTITFSDMAGRTIDAYHTVNTQGEYTYTWYPRALQKGLYLVSLYLDGELMQTVKVIKN